jgi:pimeloyl-ACP methyl ester carboxylesterase
MHCTNVPRDRIVWSMTMTQPTRKPFSRLPFEQLPELPRVPHPYFEAESSTLTIDTPSFGRIRIHHRTFGSGPPLLLVHGLMTSGYSWRYVLNDLGSRFRLVVPDLPGCGRSDKPPERSYTPSRLAAWIGEFQDAVGITGCPAVGNSLGGYLCLRRILDSPNSFARLAVIHSPLLPNGRMRALHGALSMPGAARTLAWWIRRNPQRWAHSNVHYYDETLKSREEAREYGEPLSTVDGARAFVRWLTEGLDPADMVQLGAELRRRLTEGIAFPVPLLLLYASEDPLVDPAIGDRLLRLVPSATLVRVSRSSHFAHVDTPISVSHELLKFLPKGG